MGFRRLTTCVLAAALSLGIAASARAEFEVTGRAQLAPPDEGVPHAYSQIAASASGVYVADGSGIDRVSWNATPMSRVTGLPVRPSLVAANPDGTLFVSDRSNVVALAPDGSVVAQWQVVPATPETGVLRLQASGGMVDALVLDNGATVLDQFTPSGSLVAKRRVDPDTTSFGRAGSVTYVAGTTGVIHDLAHPARTLGTAAGQPQVGQYDLGFPLGIVGDPTTKSVLVADNLGQRLTAFDTKGGVRDVCPAVIPDSGGALGFPVDVTVGPNGRIAVLAQSGAVVFLRDVRRATRPCDPGRPAVFSAKLSAATVSRRHARLRLTARMSKHGSLAACLARSATAPCTERRTIRFAEQNFSVDLAGRLHVGRHRPGRYVVRLLGVSGGHPLRVRIRA